MVDVKQAQDYELILIINPGIEDETLDAVINGVSQFITTRGGTVGNIDRWGKKKLAYPLKHQLEGHYIMMRVNMNPSLSRDVENQVKITEQILRHMLIRVGS